MIVVDVIEDFLNSLSLNLKTLSFFYDKASGKTSVVVDNYLFARDALDVAVNATFSDNSTTTLDSKIKSVDTATSTIVIEVDFFTLANPAPFDPAVDEEITLKSIGIELPRPMFRHGTPYAVNNEIDRDISYPLVYLLEILKERLPSSRDSAYETTPTIRLFFLDESDFRNLDTDALYSNVVVHQRNWMDYFLKKLRDERRLFDLPSAIEVYTFAKFGQYANNKGMINSIFNKELSGVELRMDLPIRRKGCY